MIFLDFRAAILLVARRATGSLSSCREGLSKGIAGDF
jgi:hypothetical protein